MQEYLNCMKPFLCVHKLKVEKKPQLYGRMKWQLATQSCQTERKYCGVNLTSEVIQSIFNGKIIWKWKISTFHKIVLNIYNVV